MVTVFVFAKDYKHSSLLSAEGQKSICTASGVKKQKTPVPLKAVYLDDA